MRLSILAFLPLLAGASPLSLKSKSDSNPLWYDQGLYGAYPTQEYVSFDLSSPRVNILQWNSKCDQSYTFLEPRGRSVADPGPMILDARGNLVYTEKKYGQAMDLRVQRYKGEDFITFWAGNDDGTHGRGRYYMLDSSYEVRHVVGPANNLEGDLHEFQLTQNGTALMTIYEIIPADLSAMGGPKDGWIYDGLFQEIDVATGDLIFQWRASSHYHISDSFAPRKSKGKSHDDAWDYFHINSVDKDADGNYYISSRYMHTITCISPKGEVLWKLGGAASDFRDLSQGAASNFSWQHHVRWFQGNQLTVFDNAAYDNNVATMPYSRGLLIQLDMEAMTATLITDFVSPMHISAHSQGSVQRLNSGNYFVGWGHSAAYTEFTPQGHVVCNVHFGASSFFGWGWIKSYRTFKGAWVGRPNTLPAIARKRNKVYVSWNGATEVKSWKLQGTDKVKGNFTDIDTIKKNGFEDAFSITGTYGDFLRVAALDSEGEVMAVSELMNAVTGQIVNHAYTPIQDSDVVPLQFLLVLLSLVTLAAAGYAVRKPALGYANAIRLRFRRVHI
ncbi:uncharacterized protein K452DRAFT_168393 [Aplosporella prunicola CBS 121167]|uniref:Arylsulfotransferase n=1 Tax=Aplosporella prunicola CBS 121167 TaxID=1176127 RepID=A0A6A6BJ04_9PEZI|nr:uncharacterized protein K452DRAFT_168393 [Aplosporella prunicola CBS 121167]KAF2143264.1 hypothetical protein K452DRAFT_168393 [Aplosporella prunicola CBS 121167]